MVWPMTAPFLTRREALNADLGGMPSPFGRLAMRAVALLFGPLVQVDGRAGLAEVPGPAIFVLNHNNTFECCVVPGLLMAARQGRPVSFLVDWMFLRLPLIGRLIRCIDPIPVYTKPARFHLWEGHRQARRARSALGGALERLAAGGSVGVFPEGTRNGSPLQLERGRAGLGHLVLATDVPVVPIGIVFPAARRLGRTPRIGRIHLRIGEPMGFLSERAALPPEDRRETARRAAAVVAQVMASLAELCDKAYPFEPAGRSEEPLAAVGSLPSSPRRRACVEATSPP